ncbi:hypothetical protein M409DRAFT_22089 [Zasmidium cellare ATCC 36951]|uniref:SnoaL-like domain-containing protein n=1 Tax=Zasmidium cellare ATCC 36951 TaxID=1080233 RepID=A0A6A6CL57_ZASCE|nr:uncharacterized protein M409DRAFT_22089 [Zasmidium cellare ATCC 36951]KAF2167944.1 hypothetical protein M409DRAFT_22089 [Zasmidium cellare ATCC 36951]
MESLLAKASIQETLHRLAYAQDELDRSALQDLFIPNEPIPFDASHHMSHIPAAEVTPDQLWEAVYPHSAGFTATRHMLGNMLVTFEGEGFTKAHVKCQIDAYHCIDRREEGGALESVTARGLWLMDVEVWEGKWVFRKITIRRDVPLDHPELYAVAVERSGKGMGRKAKE